MRSGCDLVSEAVGDCSLLAQWEGTGLLFHFTPRRLPGACVLSSLSVQVAPPADGTEEVATVKLTITGDGINIEEQKKVLICQGRNGTIIQTDKSIYEAGQTGEMQMGAAEGPRLFAGCTIWKDCDALKCMNSPSRRL